MTQIVLSEDLVKRYLLGDVEEDVRQQLEERLLTDDEFFQDFAELEDRLEDELIDAYIGGVMLARARTGFEKVFLTAANRVEKYMLARDLHDYVNAPAPAPAAMNISSGESAGGQGTIVAGVSPEMAEWFGQARGMPLSRAAARAAWWQGLRPTFFSPNRLQAAFAAITITLLISMIASAMLYTRARRLEAELRALQQQQLTEQSAADELAKLRARNEELSAALQRMEAERRANAEPSPSGPPTHETTATGGRPKPSSVFALTLSLVRTRDAGESIPTLKLPADASSVRLRLKLDTIEPADYRNYHAVVTKRDGTVVKTSPRLRATSRGRKSLVTLTLPARSLPTGDYLVRLTGQQADSTQSLIGVYDFRLIHQ